MNRNRGPYGLELIQSCLSCRVREERLFCQLGTEALAQLEAIRQTSVYPEGAVLFVEGQPCQGLYVLCSGRVKLATSSPRGRSLIVRVACPGEVLGLEAVLSNATYNLTAETLEPAQVNFLPRDDFLRFLQSYGEVSVRVAQHLSMELRRAYQQAARIALAPTARAKLAGLLLDWASPQAHALAPGTRFQFLLTHEEIGELIGASRETVTRHLSDFRRKGLIQVEGPAITVLRPTKLQELLT